MMMNKKACLISASLVVAGLIAFGCRGNAEDSHTVESALDGGGTTSPAPSTSGGSSSPGFHFQDVLGDKTHPIENGVGSIKQTRVGPVVYDFSFVDTKGSFPLTLRNAAFPVNPVGGARQVGGLLVVCNTAFKGLNPMTTQDILTTCGVFGSDGQKRTTHTVPGAWFKTFVNQAGKTHIRFVPRINFLKDTQSTSPDCTAVDISDDGKFTPRMAPVFCSPDRDPGTPCYTSSAPGEKGTINGTRDSRGVCMPNK